MTKRMLSLLGAGILGFPLAAVAQGTSPTDTSNSGNGTMGNGPLGTNAINGSDSGSSTPGSHPARRMKRRAAMNGAGGSGATESRDEVTGTTASGSSDKGGGSDSPGSPATADVLAKLHHSNQKEIQMGKLAQKNGHSQEVKNFGKRLVKDHGAADKKVMALAKQEKINLASATGMGADKDAMANVEPGADFDKQFGQSMLEDHKKDIAEATAARDQTADAALKKLLDGMLPTLQKHQDIAQKIVDSSAAAKKS